MTIKPELIKKLEKVFSILPSSSVVRLKSVFEAGLAAGDASLPFDILLNLLPSGESATDIATIFHPVTELATENAQRFDQVSNQFMHDVWHFYASKIEPNLSKTWRESTAKLHENKKFIAIGLRKIWEEEGGKERLEKEFGADNVDKIPHIFSILSFAAEISELISAWPEEIKNLDDRYLLPLRDLNDLLVESDPDITPLLLFILKSRLIHPQQILRAIERLSRQKSDLVVINTDMYLIAEALMDEAENLLISVKKSIDNEAQVDEAVYSMDKFANIVRGSMDEFEISPTSIWGKRLYKLTNEAVSFWTKCLKKSWAVIEQATPRMQTKSFLGGKLTGPDLRSQITQDQSDCAVVNAYLLDQISPYASKIGFSSINDELRGLVEDRIRSNEDNLIELLCDPGEVDLDILNDHFSVLVRITRKFQGDDIANILNRRGIAAAGSAAA